MNILKFKKIILTVLFIQLWSTSAIKAAPINAPVKTYFLPEEIEEFNSQLAKLLDNAQEQVLVAMYWLTDEDIINKFISLKQKGIDVQIIFDESANNTVNLIEKLMANDIIPYVLPKINGSMHNKFLVIDGRVVLTGSANFTKTVLSKSLRFFNNENILILYSNKIAEKYRDVFFGIEDVIARAYIDLLANQWPNQLPDWMRYVSLNLHKYDSNFVNY